MLPETDAEGRLVSPLPSSPPPTQSQEPKNDEPKPAPEAQSLDPGQLPQQIEKMLSDITEQLNGFKDHPPSTIQRLAELILRPRAHYKSLAAYLHAVDRVVMVTSSAGYYPLPLTHEPNSNPAETVSWVNPASASATSGADEDAYGGAILTPIPWVKQHQPPPQSESSDSSQGAQIHSESTETIDGPNGMGRIETVSVSVNGVHSTGHARGITQGELLRQEQKAGVVPMSQLHRPQQQQQQQQQRRDSEDAEVTDAADAQKAEDGNKGDEEDEEEEPHARGPEEIGVGDTGPQSQSTSHIGEGGLDAQGIDIEAAVGRKHDDEDKDEAKSPGSDASGVKREAEEESDAEPPAKKAKEDGEDGEDDADKMETDKEVS